MKKMKKKSERKKREQFLFTSGVNSQSRVCCHLYEVVIL